MAKYLTEMKDLTFQRTLAFPTKSNNMNTGSMFIIPTYDQEILINVLNRFKSNATIKFRNPKTMYILRRKIVKAGNKMVTYMSKDSVGEIRFWKKEGYNKATSTLGSIGIENGSVDYTKYLTFVANNKFTMNNLFTFWEAFFVDMSTKHQKFLVWTPETVRNNYVTLGAIKRTNWNNLNDLYYSFLYQLRFNMPRIIELLNKHDIKIVFTDYTSILYLDPKDSIYKNEKPDRILYNIFRYNRRIRLGMLIEEEDDDDITMKNTSTDFKVVHNLDEEDISEEDIIEEELLDESEELGISDDIIDKLESIGKNKNDDKLEQYANAVMSIIEKTNLKNKVMPERNVHVIKREKEVVDKNLVDTIKMLEKMNKETIDPRLVKAEGHFTKFKISDMDKSYRIKQEKQDRLDCLSHMKESKKTALYLTNYKEELDLNTTDSKVKNIQVTYTNPTDTSIQHTFSFKLPVLREDKFLYLGNSDKTLSRQIISLPIVRLKDKVAFTTYYKKMFIEPVNNMAHISRQVAKIKRFIKAIRKKFNLKDISMFSFTPSYTEAIKNNNYSEELVDITRYVSSVVLDDRNEIMLKATDKYVGKINGQHFFASNDDLIHSEDKKTVYTIIEFFDKIITQIDNKELVELWNASISGRYTNNLLYATTTAVMSNLPVLYVILHSLDYNLLTILDRLKEEYNLEYKIIPHDGKIQRNKDYDTTDDIVFSNFTLRLKYNNLANRTLLAPLLQIELSDLEDLNLEPAIGDDISNNLKMELDNFYDLFIDPISKGVMEDMGVPTDYIGALIYCNALLFNYDRPINELSLKQQRIPSNAEIIQGAMYKAITSEFSSYTKKIKNGANPQKVKFTVAPDAVIKVLQQSPNLQESSKLNPVEHVTSLNVFTGKGLAGLGDNKDRSFTLQRRMWDDSFIGIVSDVSPYSATTGVNRQLSMNPNITSIRGYFDLNTKDVNEYTMDETMSISEGLGTFAQKHDSSNRLAMGMSQFTHLMPTEGSEPSLITYGMDEALSYLDSDFVYRATDDGVVLAINNSFIKIKYQDGEEVVYSFDEVVRNAAKAFYIPNTMKINNKLKVGMKVNKDTVLAYNTMLYEEFDEEVPIFKSGPIAYVAVAPTQESYEDSVVVSENLASRLVSKTVKRVTARLQSTDIIGEFYKLGDKDIQPGEIIIKYLKTDGKQIAGLFGTKNEISDVLSTKVISHYQGRLRDIYIHHKLTEKDKMHKSVSEFFEYVENYYNKKDSTNKFRTKYKLDNNRLVEHIIGYPVSKKVKVNTDQIQKGEILVEFFIEVDQPFSVGDKITFGNTALKGVCSTIRKDDERPYGEKTGRRADAVISPISPLARIVYSFFLNGVLSECMVNINNEIQNIIDKHK